MTDSFLFDPGVTGCKKRIFKSIQQKEHRLSIFIEGELMKQADDLLSGKIKLSTPPISTKENKELEFPEWSLLYNQLQFLLQQ